MQESAGVTDPTEIERLASEGYEAADFLETFVVQAKLNKRGNFGRRSLASCTVFYKAPLGLGALLLRESSSSEFLYCRPATFKV